MINAPLREIVSIKESTDFNTLFKKAKKIKKDSNDYIVSIDEFKNIFLFKDNDSGFNINFLPTLNKESEESIKAGLSNNAFIQLCNKLKIPAQYMNKCIEQNDSEFDQLVLNNFNTWMNHTENKSNMLFRGYKDYIRGILTQGYSIFDTDEILDIISDTIDIEEYTIRGHVLNEERFHIRLVSREPLNIENEDDIFSGIMIDSSDVGRSSLTVRYFVFKQICTNGLVINKANSKIMSKIHRGINKDNFRELLSQSLNLIGDFDEKVIEMINKAQKVEIPFYDNIEDYNKFLDKVQNNTNLPRSIIDKAVDIMDERYKNTAWGLINGITEIARDRNIDSRIEIETMASNILAIKEFN